MINKGKYSFYWCKKCGKNIRQVVTSKSIPSSDSSKPGRTALKPMQPMRLHWPRAMVVGQVVSFCQILLAHENC